MKNKTISRLGRDFYIEDVLQLAPGLLGKLIVLRDSSGRESKFRITETEAYRGEEDQANHASRGRTARTEIMYHEGGHIYVYLIYGIHWMLNVVSSHTDVPQAVLIRAVEGYPGPGRLSKALGIDRSFYGVDLADSDRIWIESDGLEPVYSCSARVGIEYAGSPWKDKPWRYIVRGER